MRKASSFGGTAIRRLAAVVLLGILGVAVLTTRPQIPGPLFEALTALQDAVQQFSLEEEGGDFTFEDLLDSGLEAQPSEDGQSCTLYGVKVWLLGGKPRIFVVCWQKLWYLLEAEKWRVFKVEGASGPDEARRFYEAGKAVLMGNLR